MYKTGYCQDPIWIKAKYERLQNFCYKCGRLGLDQRACSIEENANRFGNWLSIFVVMPLGDLICCYKEGWDEVEEGMGKVIRRAPEVVFDKREDVPQGEVDGEKKQMEVNVVGMYDMLGEAKVETRSFEEPILVAEKVLVAEKEVNTGYGTSQYRRKIKVQRYVKNSVDVSKAIVFYGSIFPVFEDANSLKRVRLKRDRDEEDEAFSKRKKRLCFEEEIAAVDVEVKKSPKKIVRRSVRTLKRQMRMGVGVGLLRADKMVESMDKELLTEGCGGWPSSTTNGP